MKQENVDEFWQKFRKRSSSLVTKSATSTIDQKENSKNINLFYIDGNNSDETLKVSNSVNEYKRHTNLDAKQLTVLERINLARIHYCTIGRFIRILVVIFLLLWFVFNSFLLIQQYVQYDTVVYISHEIPKLTAPPAISICTYCIFCSYVLYF